MKSYECHLMEIIKVIHFISISDFCDSSLAGKMAVFFCDLTLTHQNRLWCFHRKPYLKSDSVVGLTRSVSLKWCEILLCLRNLNYGISVVLNLAPCIFTGCCHIDPVRGISALRSFKGASWLSIYGLLNELICTH